MNVENSIIKCPICDESLVENTTKRLFCCANNHSYDVSKKGYVNLLISNKNKSLIHGDSAEMLEARKNILYGGFYKIISNSLNETVDQYLVDSNENYSILDIGCGIGYYLINLKDYMANENIGYYGIDISKNGMNTAAKLSKEITWIVGTNNKLPYHDNSVDLVISVFSPINETECERVLKHNGLVIVINPDKDHLMEMKKIIYPSIIEKEENRNEFASSNFSKVDRKIIKETIYLKKEELKDLLLMTPHYWMTTKESKENLYALDSLDVGIEVIIDIYKNKIN